MADIVSILFIIFAFAIFVGTFFLEAVLAKKESIIPGLILPIISLVMSFIVVAGSWAFTARVETSPTAAYSYEELDASYTDEPVSVTAEAGEQSIATPGIGGIILIPLLMNIPTAVYLAIFFGFHTFPKKRQNDELQKMSIQDL